jgi:glycosidase
VAQPAVYLKSLYKFDFHVPFVSKRNAFLLGFLFCTGAWQFRNPSRSNPTLKVVEMNRKAFFRISFLTVTLMGLLFLFVQPAFAVLNWVGDMSPAGGSTHTVTTGTSFNVYVQVYQPGVTDSGGQGANITCTLTWKPVPYFGWSGGMENESAMTYNKDIGNNDEYVGTITPDVGLYEISAYCTDTTDNIKLEQATTKIKLTVDAASGTCNGAAQGDNNLYWNGLFHDSFSTSYRIPTGPVTTDSTVTLTFRTCMDDVTAIPTIRIWNDLTNTSTTPAMTFDGHGSDPSLGGVTYWTYDLAVDADPTIYYYVFNATDGSATAYYRDDDPKFYGGGYGAAEANQTTAYDNSYQLTVYDPDFDVPEWMQTGVVYQIFPDRFRDGDPTNNPAAERFFYNEAGGTIVRSNDVEADWNTAICDPRSSGGCLGDYSNNFYGGDLAGITEKINAGYFDQLGVSVLYLNPIFLSPSNHKYDTANYLKIDPDFGTLSDFQAMVTAANAHNIKIILDGVFNHTSSDSIYFDRYGRYNSSGTITDPDGGTDDNSGACESPASGFRTWFYIPDQPGGESAGNQPDDRCDLTDDDDPTGAWDQTYTAWYGYGSLPKLQANSTAVRELIWSDSLNSVGPFWTHEGASGWRFDVGGDVDGGLTNLSNNDYWEGFRSAVRDSNVTGKSDTLMLGEEWGDASAWLLGNEWDSVMNYRYRSAVLSWLFTGCSGDGCTGGTSFSDNDSNSFSSSGSISAITPSQFNARLLSIQEDYPPMAWKAMMNLEGSHDTNRIRFLLTKINGNDDDLALQRMKELWLFAFTYAGAPTLYYGDEVGLSQDGVWSNNKWEDDPYNRAPFPWDDETGADFTADTSLQDFARMMASIRHSYPALQDGDVQHGILIDDVNKLYGFARTNGSQTALIVLNRDDYSPHDAFISGLDAAPYALEGKTLVDVITGTTYTVLGGEITVDVSSASGAVLLEQDKIETPAEPDSATFSFNGSDVTLGWNLVSLDSGSGRETPTVYTIHRSATYPFTPGAGNWLADVNPPAYGAAQSRLTYTDTGASGTLAYAICAENAGGKAGCVFLAPQCAASTNRFRSTANGLWTDETTWQVSPDGISWAAASCWPTANNDTIQIQSGHTVTVGSNFSVDQLTINGQVTIDSGSTLTIANGADATDATVSAGANLTVNGTLNNTAATIVANGGTATIFTVNGTVINSGTITTTAATAAYNNGSTYQHNFTTTGGTIPTASWNSNSTVLVSGYTTYGGTPGGYGQAFGNFTWYCPSQSGAVNFSGNLTKVNGNFSVLSTGSGGELRLTGNTAFTMNIVGDLTISAGLFISSNGTANPIINVGGNVVLGGGTLNAGGAGSGVATYNVAGNWLNNGGTFTPRTGTVTFNGSSAQTIGGSAATTFNNLTLNNANGATLGANATVSGTLTLTSGALGVGTNTLTLSNTVTCGSNVINSSATGTVSYARTSAGQTVCAGTYGNLTFNSVSKTLPSSGTVGIAGTFTTGSTAGTVTGSTVAFNGTGAQTIPAYTFNNLTLNNASGATLGGTVTVGGALSLTSGTLGVGTNTLNLNGAVTCGSNVINSSTTGTVSYAQASAGQAVCAGTYGNLTFNNNNKTLSPSGTIGIAGTFTPGSATGHTVTGSTVDFNGADVQTIPAFNYNNLVSSSSGARTLASSGTIGVAGAFTPGTNSYTVTGSTVNLNGSSAQTIPGFTFYNLNISNVSGVSLSGGDVTVNGSLTLGANKITTGANKVIFVSTTIFNRTSGWIHGNLQKPVLGSSTINFEVGDATDYAPISVTFSGVTTSGTLTGSTTDGQHPRYMDTDISDENYINRYWTLTPGGGLAFTSYNATFTFNNPGDFIGAPTPGTSEFMLRKYDPPASATAWSSPPGGAASSDSTTVTGTGFTSFSDFFAGNGGTPLPVTLSYFNATRIGTEVLFGWSTATESGNLGFNLYAVDGDGQRILLNQELIPSQDIDSLARLDYNFQVETPFDTFYIEDVNVNGWGDWHGPYQIGETYGSRVEENRIDWASIQAEHQTVRKELSLELLGRPEMLSLNLKVRQTGLYRVTYEMLRDAGLDLGGLPAGNLLLTNRGKQVPMYVAGADSFGPGGFIEFYGQALDTLYTDANVYILQVSPTPVGSLLVEDTVFDRGLAEGEGTYIETLEVNNQRAFADYAPGTDAWYDTSMLVYTSAQSWDFPFQVDGLANTAGTSNLELVVWGVTNWPQSSDHHLLVSVNGLQVATDTFDGLVEQTIKIKLPAGLLREGENTLRLTLPGDTGAIGEVVNLDKFSVTYPRLLQAREGHLAFIAAGRSFTVTNLSSADVVVYRLNAKGAMTRLDLVRARPANDGTFNATFSGTPQPAKYLVSTIDAMYTPGYDMPYAQVNLDRPAQYLVISHPDFIDGLQPLIEAREAQGLTVSVVDVTDLYARYTSGIFDPQAIKQYIAYATRNLGTEYVLLVGGDTYDYRNYLGINSISFIPSIYVSTGPLANFVPADPLYADVNDDNVPDVALGRFPVRSVAELNLMVSKTLAYAAKDYGQTAAFASDLNDGGLSFKDINNDMASLLPPSWTVENIHLSDLNVTTARSQLIAAMNRGTALVTFTGHSGPQEWTFSDLFNMSNAAALTNHGRPFVVVQWGCWNSYYVDPVYNYMVQSFLFSGDQGAAAVLGASTLTDSTSEVLLGKLLTPRLVAPGMPVGQALLEAKLELAQTHPELLDVLLGWSLMGDPTLVIAP